MARVKGGTHSIKRRRNILSKTKGYKYGRSTKERQAREALMHAGSHAFQHRRKKKNDFRRLWNTRISAGLTEAGSELSYSKFIKALKDSGVGLDRKILAGLAKDNPEGFKKVVEKVS